MEPKANAVAANIFENTIAVSINFDGISGKRHVSMDGVTVDADKDQLGLASYILDCEEMRAIKNVRSKVWTMIASKRRGLTLPSIFKGGVFLIPVAMFEQVDTVLRQFAEELTQRVNDLASVYEQRIEEDRLKLRSKFDIRHYPAKDALHAVWSLRWRYFSLAPSTVLKTVNAAAYSAEVEKANAEMVELGDEIKRTLREATLELVTHMHDRLGFDEKGKRKIFRESVVENLIDFLNLFEKKNIMNDTELASHVSQMRALLKGVDAVILRSDEDFRDQLATKVGAIKDELSNLVTVQGRKIVLPEDDTTPPDPSGGESVAVASKKSAGGSKSKKSPKVSKKTSSDVGVTA